MITIKEVPVKVVRQIEAGVAHTHNNAEFHYEPVSAVCVKVGIRQFAGAGSAAHFDEEACREAAGFFSELADALHEIKE